MTSQTPWPLAVRVAGRVAGHYPLESTYHTALLQQQMPEVVERAGRLVEEETGLVGGGSPRVEVVSRATWVERNLAFFAKLLEPAEEKLIAKVGEMSRLGQASARMARRLVAAETGVLLGVMARRVLGQYELVLPADPEDAGDTVYLVGANVLHLERAYQLRPSEFRMWLALHESTHRLQFIGVPWMRQYFLGLVQQLIASAEPEQGRLSRVTAELVEALRSDGPVIDEAGLLGLFANEQQRELIDRVQALMSLLEGHGHVVMDRVGARILVTQERMSAMLKRRRQDPRTAAFYRLTGLEMKMRQYEQGERFVLDVERQAGWEALAVAWSEPEALPTRGEIENPGQWLARVA